ncbi:MAG TPA: ABC transporter permease [Acidimicrobiia bacterium]
MTNKSDGESAVQAASQPRQGQATAGRSEPGLAERYALPVLFLILIVGFSLALPDTFASVANLRAILTTQAVPAIAAMALMLPLVAGRFDISIGAIIGVCSIVTAAAMSTYNLSLPVAIGLALIVGLVVGAANGLLVAYLGVNSIIATLGTTIILSGLIQAYTRGIPISSGLSPTLTSLSAARWLGVPALFVIMLVVAILVSLLVNQTPFGRYMTATGSNEIAAQLNGMAVRRILSGSFAVAGLLAGMAGVLQVAAQGNGNPQVGGIGFILPALAAVFLGATTLRPGTYNIPGTILALYFIAVTVIGLALLGAQPWVTDVVNGISVVVAVTLSAQFRRRRTGESALGS